MPRATPKNAAHRFVLGTACLLFLASCSTPLRVDSSILDRGIFVINSRGIKPSATEQLDSETGESLPKSRLHFDDLESRPQLRFRGVLEPEGSSSGMEGSLITRHIRTLDFDAFHRETGATGTSTSFRKAVSNTDSLLIFVHGFNNSVRDAAEQAVEIQAEMDAQDAKSTVMFYTWPTSDSFYQVVLGGALRKATFGRVDSVLNDVYLNDRKNIDIAAHALYALYEELDRLYPKLKIDIVAHSMGSEVVLKSFLLWHYHRMIQDKRRPEEIQIARRVVLVGADIGLDLFKVLAVPSTQAADQILVYVNPRDAVLGESTKLNDDQARVGGSPLDTPMPGISEQFTFVELADPLLPKGANPVKQFLVNHNPLSDERILHHACRFVETGKIVENTPSLHVHEKTGGRFQGSGAAYYRVHFDNDDILEAVGSTLEPIQQVPGAVRDSTGAAVGVVRGGTGAAVGAVKRGWPKRFRFPADDRNEVPRVDESTHEHP